MFYVQENFFILLLFSIDRIYFFKHIIITFPFHVVIVIYLNDVYIKENDDDNNNNVRMNDRYNMMRFIHIYYVYAFTCFDVESSN